MRTYIFKYNVLNFVSLVIRHLDFKTLHHHYFEHASNKVMYYVLNNVEDVKKIYFPIQEYVYHSCTLRKIH